jgi:hypothetical protein
VIPVVVIGEFEFGIRPINDTRIAAVARHERLPTIWSLVAIISCRQGWWSSIRLGKEHDVFRCPMALSERRYVQTPQNSSGEHRCNSRSHGSRRSWQ